MLSVLETQQKLAATQRLPLASEAAPLAEAIDRRLANDVHAIHDVPPAANSAMDGYAVIRSDLERKNYRLPISQRIPAGAQAMPLEEGTCARIFTGANLPPNADAVIIQENTECQGQTSSVGEEIKFTLSEAPAEGANVRPQGQDIAIGQRVACSGDKITPALAGLLASQGFGLVEVQRKLRIALLSTGNEIVEPGQPLENAQIYNSNRYSVAGLISAWGAAQLTFEHVSDDLNKTQAALAKLAEGHDLIVSFGGVSVGDEDHIKTAVRNLGTLEQWKVKLKPGKPLMFGEINHCDTPTTRSTPILGLPGNPVSSFVTFLLFGRTLLNALVGDKSPLPAPLMAPLGFAIERPRKRPEYLRVNIEGGELIPCSNQSSGVLSSLHHAYGLAKVPADTTLKKGDLVECYPLSTLIYR